MRIAVTGATGFLGRRFVEVAARRGASVRALVRPRSQLPPQWQGERVAVVRGELADAAAARALLAPGVDVLVHLASAGVGGGREDWVQLLSVNVIELRRWLGAAHEAGASSAVVTGSCLEYRGVGELPDAPLPAEAIAPPCVEDSPLATSDLYGASKAAGGLVAHTFARAAGFPLWYLRLASLCGPGDTPTKLLPTALRRLSQGQPVNLSGGEQVREWMHRDDAVSLLLAAVAQQPPGGGVGLVNGGPGVGSRVRDLLRHLAECLGAPESLLRFGARPYRPGEPHHLVMSTARREQLLGNWRPAVPLRRCLEELAASEARTPTEEAMGARGPSRGGAASEEREGLCGGRP